MNNSIRFFLFLFYFLIQTHVLFGVHTLQELHAHALSLQEFPPIDNVDWTFPDFTTYYESTKKSLVSRLLEDIGLYEPYWSIDQFQNLLTKVTEFREKQSKATQFCTKIKATPGQKYIIWGDLHGAYHSLDRSLQYLLNQGVIDNNFIISEGYGFIFNGNVINRSAYSCETLTVILTLMERNPDQVFYIRGKHEHNKYWKDETLVWELQLKGVQITSKDTSLLDNFIIKFFNILPLSLFIPLEDMLTRFFNTLPQSLCIINDQQETDKVMQISGFTTEYITKKNKEKNSFSDNIQAYILSENRRFSYNRTEGLIQLDDIYGKIVWSVFSSPIRAHQELVDFYHDAFVVCTITNSVDTWTLQLVHRNIKNDDYFKEEKERFLISGELVNPLVGISVVPERVGNKFIKDITLGCTLDLSRGNKIHGEQIKSGTELWIDYEKEQNNTTPEIIYQDDAYDLTKTRHNIEKFLSNGVDIIINSVGSANTHSYLDLIQSGKIVSLFPVTGASVIRKPDLTHIIHYRKGYKDEGKILLKYAHEKLQVYKYAIFYQNDSMGISALNGALEMKKTYAISDDNWLEVSYNRNDTWYDNQYKKIKNFNPDIIIFCSTAFVTRNFIQQAGIDFFVGKKLLGLSDLTEYTFTNFIQEKGLHFVLTSVVPDPVTSKLTITQLFRQQAQKEKAIIDPIAFESFITTAIMMDMLKNIQGPITKEALIGYAQNYNDYDLYGLKLTFHPESRELSNAIWLYSHDEGWQIFGNN